MTTKSPSVRASHQLTLRDRLSRLRFSEACKLLGPDGKRLIERNANGWDFEPDDIYLGDDLFRLRFPGEGSNDRPLTVTVTLMAEAPQRLHWRCNHCDATCEHVGAAFSLILEEKTALGLAAPPPERKPVASLAEPELIALAIAERKERAKAEKMVVESHAPAKLWTDYLVRNKLSGRTYRVALRGAEPGESYCSCPDFRTNTLGTCKHVLHVLEKGRRKFGAAALRKKFVPKQLALHLHYVGSVSLWLQVPKNVSMDASEIIAPLVDRPITNIPELMRRLARLAQIGEEVVVYPDAEEFIQQRLFQEEMGKKLAAIRRDPANHPLRTSLLKIPLLNYQLDGAAFAAGIGRAVLADEMGLGKTIQGVATAELLAQHAGIRKVLVVCPASLKSQWRAEIHRFCERDTQLIGGPSAERLAQYQNDSFYTICNYEQVLRDIQAIERVPWDLIILDEGQRIKNWESKTSRTIKGLRSKFALVLTGTPLENRLDELYSVVQFIDDRRLGPGFRFFNRHRVVDDKGRVLGYKNLDQLRATLQSVLLRRTRDSVRLEIPPRTTELVRIAPTDEQLAIHRSHMQIVSSITRKKFLTEMDLLRLQKALLMCRMSADSTYLVNKETPAYSTKLEYLADLFDRLFEEPDRKVVLFSEWTTMLDLIEPLLKKRRLEFVRLDGGVPQKRRPELVERFQSDPTCKLFLSTNAGSTGLNLQAANTVVNVDLPWNPAVLEQRIARAHRMGQEKQVQVYVLMTEGTIEESLLKTLTTKRDLALAALDPESEVAEVDLASGIDQLKSRLEVLLGAAPEAPVDQSQAEQTKVSAPPAGPAHRDRVAAAGGELLGAAFKLLGELVSQGAAPSPSDELVASLRSGLSSCVEEDPQGRQRLSISLPDRNTLDTFARSLAALLTAGEAAKK